MTIDDPSPGMLGDVPLVRPAPETLRHSLAGVRQALFGIELTLLAVLLVLPRDRRASPGSSRSSSRWSGW